MYPINIDLFDPVEKAVAAKASGSGALSNFVIIDDSKSSTRRSPFVWSAYFYSRIVGCL